MTDLLQSQEEKAGMTSAIALPGDPVIGSALLAVGALIIGNVTLVANNRTDCGATITVSSGSAASAVTVSGTINASNTLL